MIEDIKRAADLMKQADGLLSRGPLSFYLDEMAAAYDLLMSRFAPFKVGDRVRLAATPVISEETAWGWLHAKHFLVKGALGVVRGASCGTRGFRFEVSFDDDTWIDSKGARHSPDTPGIYTFPEGALLHLNGKRTSR